jgi:hypothetical protein
VFRNACLARYFQNLQITGGRGGKVPDSYEKSSSFLTARARLLQGSFSVRILANDYETGLQFPSVLMWLLFTCAEEKEHIVFVFAVQVPQQEAEGVSNKLTQQDTRY